MTAPPLPLPRGGARPTRRAVLAAGVMLPLGGCTGSSPAPGPSPAPAPTPAPVDPDVALRAAAAERERGLLAAYDQVLAASRAPALLALRAEHAEHLRVLDPAATVPPAPTGGGRGAVPARATTRLRAVEREAAAAHAADALPASRGLAALLASLAAAEAAHGVVLA